MIEVSGKFVNADEFLEVLRRTMPAAMGDNVVAGALKKAAKPMVKQLAALYRQIGASGSLAAATTVWRTKARGRKGSRVRVGPLRYSRTAMARYARYYGRAPDGIRHGHLVERGTKSRTNKAGADLGKIAAQWYVERSARATLGQVMAMFRQTVGRDMEKKIASRAKRRK